MSLATIHRELYQTSGLTDVRADELLTQIVRQILSMASGPGRHFDVVTSFDDLHLMPDQAVPLSLLLTEALTNAIKYAKADSGAALRLEVTLKRAGGTRAMLEIANSVSTAMTAAIPPSNDPAPDGSGLGSQLLAAFAQQLGGDYGSDVADGWYRLWVSFDVMSLSEAEAGSKPAESLT